METEFIHLSDRYLYAKSSSNTIDMINRTNFKKIHSLKALRPKCILEVERPVDDLEIYSASIFIGCWDSIVEVINFKIIRNEKGNEQMSFEKTIKIKTASDVRNFI